MTAQNEAYAIDPLCRVQQFAFSPVFFRTVQVFLARDTKHNMNPPCAHELVVCRQRSRVKNTHTHYASFLYSSQASLCIFVDDVIPGTWYLQVSMICASKFEV